MRGPNKKYGHTIEEYNLCDHEEERAQIARALSKLTGRRVTGKVEIDLTRGAPALLRTVEKTTE
jgi:hypothetical protein